MTTEIIQKGRHRARATGHQFCWTGKGQDTPTVYIGFVISDGDADAGRVITAMKFLTPNAIEYTVEAFRNMGWQGDDLYALGQEGDSTLYPEEIELVIDHEEYNGEWRAKVAFINRIGGGMLKPEKPMNSDEFKRMAASLRTQVRAAGASGKRPSSNKPATPPAERAARQNAHPNAPGSTWDQPPPPRGGPGDDIPFLDCEVSAEPSAVAPVLRRLV